MLEVSLFFFFQKPIQDDEQHLLCVPAVLVSRGVLGGVCESQGFKIWGETGQWGAVVRGVPMISIVWIEAGGRGRYPAPLLPSWS